MDHRQYHDSSPADEVDDQAGGGASASAAAANKLLLPRPDSPADHHAHFNFVFSGGAGGGGSSRSGARGTLKRVRRVTKRAALASKHKIWDSNAASIDAALSAVDRWEGLYSSLKKVLVSSASSALSLYETAKAGSGRIEHHLLVPVRDFLIMPAFYGVERAAVETSSFLRSEQAGRLAGASLGLLRRAPLGEEVLAPVVITSVDVMRQVWAVVQYPIPSRRGVAEVTDHALTATKWALGTAGHAIYVYAKTVDATITRTLMHTQWRVLKSGPYATLDASHRDEVMDHVCERYFSVRDPISRYELAAHIRAHNRVLYRDLVLSGLLLERGRSLGEDAAVVDINDDVWLGPSPSYRTASRDCLSPRAADDVDPEESDNGGQSSDGPHSLDVEMDMVPLWFYLPYREGKRPGKDNPWVPFLEKDRRKLECAYKTVMRRRQWEEKVCFPVDDMSCNSADQPCGNGGDASRIFFSDDAGATPRLPSDNDNDGHRVTSSPENAVYNEVMCALGFSFPRGLLDDAAVNFETPPIHDDAGASPKRGGNGDTGDVATKAPRQRYPTVAKWYEPDVSNDVLVDQKRYAVSFLPCNDENCALCLDNSTTNDAGGDKGEGERKQSAVEEEQVLSDPCVKMIMRPTLWRFHGPGDEVRRSSWFVDTKRHGLQPYCEASCVVLEDAFQFLKWHLSHRHAKRDPEEDTNGIDDNVLLTVQVVAPDGEEQQLCQFNSLTKITVVQKSLVSAMALFKRRVYRGARVPRRSSGENRTSDSPSELNVPVPPQQEAEILRQGHERVNDQSKDKEGRAVPANVKTEVFLPTQSLVAPISYTANGRSICVTKDQSGVPHFDEKCEDDDNIEHLVLVVHGIGEMLRSVDLFGLALPPLSSITSCCAWMRNNHAEVLAYAASDEVKQNVGRVEYIPVEWHEAFALQSQRSPYATSGESDSPNGRSSKGPTLNDVSLKTIPHLRGFANDTLLDVLYFLSPEYHETIIDIVTFEMNLVVEKFRKLTGSDFTGRVSILGHSLGSVITWDILSHQRKFDSSPTHDRARPQDGTLNGICNCKEKGGGDFEEKYPQLSFPVYNTFMVGSPIAVFLMIRNQHRPMHEDFFLPGCKRVFNIFHPYDPAAYRIEPLIDRKFAVVEAKIITHWKGGFRVQYQTKILWKRMVDETWNVQKRVFCALESGISQLGLLDNQSDDIHAEGEDGYISMSESENEEEVHVIRCGKLNQGRRIDYMLQEKEIENANEYLFAIAAHSAYWDEKDLSLFMAREIIRSRIESEASTATMPQTPDGDEDHPCDVNQH